MAAYDITTGKVSEIKYEAIDTPNIYPTLPSAPTDESHVYRLQKIEEIEEFLRNEIKERERLYKKFRFWETTTRFLDNGLIAGTIITSTGGIAALATGIGTPIALALEGVAIATGLIQVGVRNVSKKIDLKIKKHEMIKLLAESSLNNVYNKIPKAITDGHVDDPEFVAIMDEKKRYLVEKQKIRQATKMKVTSLDEKERSALVEKTRKDERDKIAKNLTSVPSASGT